MDKASSSDPPPITYCTESWEPVGNMIFIVFLWTRRTRVSIHQNSLTIFSPSIVAVWQPLDSKSNPTAKNSSNPSAENSCTSPWLQNQQKLRFNNPTNQKLNFSKLEKEISKYVASTWIWSTITQWHARKDFYSKVTLFLNMPKIEIECEQRESTKSHHWKISFPKSRF